MKIVYESNRGEKLTLTEFPYWLNVENVLDYDWNYTTKERRRGSIIAGFAKDLYRRDLVLHVIAETLDERNRAIDRFNDLTEADIYDGKPAKIWFGDWYTYGYITGAKNEKWHYGAPVVKKTLEFVQEQSSWFRVITKRSYDPNDTPETNVDNEGIKTYEVFEDTHAIEQQGYDFNGKEELVTEDVFGYDYMEDIVSRNTIINSNVIGAEFIVNIMGPVDSPLLEIGDTVIHVNVEVPDGAYLTIDSTKKTIELTLADGDKVNAFGARDPEYYIFEPIASGANTIEWDGTFDWDIQLIEERSEPLWRTV